MSRGGITSCGRFLISLVMSKISSECLVGDHRLTNRKGDEDDDCDDDGSMMKIMMWIMLYECLVGEVNNMPHHQCTVGFQPSPQSKIYKRLGWEKKNILT